MKKAALLLLAGWCVAVEIASHGKAHFWETADHRGDRFLQAKRYAEAARTYADPARIGVAEYRGGEFEAAARTFKRVPGAVGAFDEGNAWLMHGQYATAIAAYDRALALRPGWPAAAEDRALAQARLAQMQASGEKRGEEEPPEEKPDSIVFDQKGEDRNSKPVELAAGDVSDEELRASWLRRVQTSPADFLRAKFSYQAAHAAEKGGPP